MLLGQEGKEEKTLGVINPYIAGSPVRDPSMFFGRRKVIEAVRTSLLKSDPVHVVVLHGQRRMGKTSTLCQIPFHLLDRHIPLLLDLQGMSLNGLPGLLWEMAHVIRRGLRRLIEVVLPREERQAWLTDPQDSAYAFFDTIRQILEDRHIILMFDETALIADKIGAGLLEDRVFACFSDLMSRYPFLDFIFSIGSEPLLMQENMSNLSRPVAYLEIGFLEPDAARMLIVQPVHGALTYEPQAIDRILRLTSGQPYYTQLVCHELFNHMLAEGRHTIHIGDVDAICPRVVETATSQMQYMWEGTCPLGQRVLTAIAETEKQGYQVTSVKQVSRFLAERGIVASQVQTEECLQELKDRYIVADEQRCSFRMDLFRYWILRNQQPW